MSLVEAAVVRERTAPAREIAIAEMRPRLLGLARTMRAADAEDLVQTTIETALRRASQLNDPAKLWPWLVTIQTREMFRWARRLGSFSLLRSEPTVHAVELRSYADLRDAFDKLPVRMRAAIAIHHLAGLSVAETANAMGTSENTVKTQLRLGLRRMKESLE